MKKVLIVDDEEAGRKLIRDYLQDHDDLIPVGEANNGVDAVKLTQEYQPDLLFLDIQMPGLNGFEVLARLEEIPQVIFSTAYDQYALQAFEIHAVDYLLKPYTRDRFNRAVQRLQDVEAVRPLAEQLINKEHESPEKILVNAGKKLLALHTSDIIWIRADGDYAELITHERSYLSNLGISELSTKLSGQSFLRVHRSSTINTRFIKEVEKFTNGYMVQMENGDNVRVSRGYLEDFRKIIY